MANAMNEKHTVLRHDWRTSFSGHRRASSVQVTFKVKSEGWLEDYHLPPPKIKSIKDF